MKKIERKSMSGLFKRNGIWRIDKAISVNAFRKAVKPAIWQKPKVLIHRT